MTTFTILPPKWIAGLMLAYGFWRLILRLIPKRPRIPYPPGPPAIPLLGNMMTAKGLAHVTYREWSRTYGMMPSRIAFCEEA